MIVVCTGGRIRLVRQVDHQAQCGIMARAWGNETFGRPAPYEALIDAAECHDEGWRGHDLTPRIDATGRPVNFPDLDRAIHAPMYELGIAEAVIRGPRVGLLASMHGQGLYEKRMGLDGPCPPRDDRPTYELAFLRDQERLQAELRAHLGDSDALQEWAWAAYRILQAWDVLSLYLCWDGLDDGREWILPRVPRVVGDPGIDIRVGARDAQTCTVDPWPFADDRVDLSVPARWIEDHAYPSDAAVCAAVDSAEQEVLTVVAIPGSARV
jgi:hypothetical protein